MAGDACKDFLKTEPKKYFFYLFQRAVPNFQSKMPFQDMLYMYNRMYIHIYSVREMQDFLA